MAKSSRKPRLRLNESNLREIRVFLENIESLPNLLDLSSQQKVSVDISGSMDKISKLSKIGFDDVRSIFSVLQNLLKFSEQDGGAEAAVDRLQGSLPPEIAANFNDKRGEICDIVTRYTREDPIHLSYKAYSVTHDREKLYQEADIFTDARPVFSHDACTIVDLVITHELAITIQQTKGLDRVHLSLDNSDLMELRDACERALLKAKTLKKAIGNNIQAEILSDDAED